MVRKKGELMVGNHEDNVTLSQNIKNLEGIQMGALVEASGEKTQGEEVLKSS